MLRPNEVFISRFYISCFGVNAFKQFTPGFGDQVVRLGLFGGESGIIAREGNLEVGAKKLTKLVG